MKVKSIILLLVFSAAQLMAQRPGFNVNFNGYRKQIASLSRMGVDYVSVRQLSELLGGAVFYNPSNSKMEVRFNTVFVKFTAQNSFVVVTQKIGGLAVTRQYPSVPIEVNADLFVPAAVYADLFASSAGRNIEYRKDARELLVDAKDFRPEKPKEKIIAKTEKKEPEKTVRNADVKKENTADAENLKTVHAEKKQDDAENLKTVNADKKQADAEEKSEEKTEEIKTADNSADQPEEIKAAKHTAVKPGSSKFDIYDIDVDAKANGTLIKLMSKKKIAKFSTSLSAGVLYVNVLGASADVQSIESAEASGLLKKASAKNMGQNSQVELHLKDGYTTYEAFRDEAGQGLFISIHNKLLNKANTAGKDSKWTLRTVVIDAGHGGKDPGAIGVTGVKEKDVNLGIALKLGEEIQKKMPEVRVVYTRQTDKFVELYKRGKIANEKNGNLFISIHCNSTPSKPTNASGFEIYLLRPGRTKEAIAIAEMENKVINLEDNPSKYQKLTAENFILVSMAHSSFMRYSERFSDILNRQFSKDLTLSSNGIKQAGFYVLVGASMPSVLVETGFISNRDDEKYIAGNAGQAKMAESIYKAIASFRDEYERNMQMEAAVK